MDSRSEYYKTWDQVAREVVEEVDAETEQERTEAEAALGLDKAPKSEAEAKDKEAHAALKEAKRRWNEREKQEQATKLVISERKDEEIVLSAVDFGTGKRVACVAQCERCTVILPAGLSPIGVIKLFVEDCIDLTLRLECRLVTSFVDVARCERVRVSIAETLHTVQCDLSRDIALEWASARVWDEAAPEGPKVYHAGCRQLEIDAGDGRKECFLDYLSGSNDEGRAEEQQFVTHILNGSLVTERIIHAGDSSNLIGATEREVDAHQADMVKLKEAERKRTAGNDCFKRSEYSQAAVHYTLALDVLNGQPRSIVLANRAACFLKLGEPEKALSDAEEAILLDPHYCKAHFRKGLAFHAQQRYKEALHALAKARDLEPKNRQVLDAIRFAEMRLAKGPGPTL